MADSRFWKERQAEFLAYADRFADVWAKWHAPSLTWRLFRGRPPAGETAPQTTRDIFNAIAQKAVVGLSQSDAEGEGEPWELWLAFMKKREWGGYRVVDSPIACSEREWDAGVRDGKSLLQVRREQSYTTGSEKEKGKGLKAIAPKEEIYRRTKGGGLRRLSARELSGKNSDDLRKYFHWLYNGRIECVFQSSADFCETLDSRAVGADRESSMRAGGVKGATGRSTPRSGERRRRRRTRTIAARKKAAAVQATEERQVGTGQEAQQSAHAGAGVLRMRRFRKTGDFWEVSFDGEPATVKHSNGMEYIACLLEAPGRSLSCVELAQAALGVSPSGAEVSSEDKASMSARFTRQNLQDREGLARIHREVKKIDEELADAEALHDSARIEQLRTDKGNLLAHVKKSSGRGGRTRIFSDEEEKARKAVSAAIQRAILRIRKLRPLLADHLETLIKSGGRCSYEGDGTDWNVGFG
jgi:hypothetical protein